MTNSNTAPGERLLQYFTHSPDDRVGRALADAAATIVLVAVSDPERTVALRKLLECKDAASRCTPTVTQ